MPCVESQIFKLKYPPLMALFKGA